MSEKNGSSKSIWIILVVLLIAAIAYFVLSDNKDLSSQQDDLPPVTLTDEPISNEDVPPQPEPEASITDDHSGTPEKIVVETKTLPIPNHTTSLPTAAASSDPAIEAMMGQRTLGSDEAPVKVVEYSSLTCGHCASFHKNDLPKIQADFIDTGKVQFIFKEYPLNQPAVIASQILRCMPADTYNNFMALLFEQQESWAYSGDYQEKLLQYAKLAGLSEETAQACMNNTALGSRIIGDMQAANEAYKIASTPTFIVNGGEKIIVGHQPYEFFQSTFDGILSGSSKTE